MSNSHNLLFESGFTSKINHNGHKGSTREIEKFFFRFFSTLKF